MTKTIAIQTNFDSATKKKHRHNVISMGRWETGPQVSVNFV